MAPREVIYCSLLSYSQFIFTFFPLYFIHLPTSSSNPSTHFTVEPRVLSPVWLGTPINITVKTIPSSPFLSQQYFSLKVNDAEWMVHEPYNGGTKIQVQQVHILASSNQSFSFQVQTTEDMHGQKLQIDYENEELDTFSVFKDKINLIWPPKPLKLSFEPPNGDLKEGDYVKVTCNAPFLGLPPQKMSFYLENAKQISAREETSTPRSLQMERVYQVSWRTHNSQLVCHLETERKAEILSVLYSPKNITVNVETNSETKSDPPNEPIELYSNSFVRCSSNGHPEPNVKWNLDPNQGAVQLKYAAYIINITGGVLRVRENSGKYLEEYVSASGQPIRELQFTAICHAMNDISSAPLEKRYQFVVKDLMEAKSARISVVMISLLSVITFCVVLVTLIICWRRHRSQPNQSQSKNPGPVSTYTKVDQKNSSSKSEPPFFPSKSSLPDNNTGYTSLKDCQPSSKQSAPLPINAPDVVYETYHHANEHSSSRHSVALARSQRGSSPINDSDYVNFHIKNGLPQAMYDSQGRPIPTEV